MKIPLIYTWRSLWTRRMTTALTLGGISLVVFVFAAVLMLANGLQQALVDTGADDNAVILRRGASTELVSQLDRNSANIIKTAPEVATLEDGKPFASGEVQVIINLKKTTSNDMGNISVRGVSPEGFQMRKGVRITEGRRFSFGTNEIIVGENTSSRFQGCGIGQTVRFGDATWMIVGHFEAGGTAFESEIWGDVEQVLASFGRPIFSAMTVRLTSASALESFKSRIEQDPRTSGLEVKGERQFYFEQSKLMATLIRVLGLIVTVIFSIGAVFGALITMYAAVANRTVEIGTIRALGFRRRSVLGAFLIESILLSLLGGGLGVGLASAMSFIQISTTNFGSFSEIAFGFVLSPGIVVASLLFALVMGILGGFAPAVRAARLNVLTALRSA
jgi:ABC-type antimicrobial peptide transport system permease subunit